MTKQMSPWVPMSNAADKKVIGKLLEELGEAVAAASRCLIQGISECDPVTGKINRQWLEEELADVRGLTWLAIAHFSLNDSKIVDRAHEKMLQKIEWVKMEAKDG